MSLPYSLAGTLSEVEDIYLPYKEKKKTRATTAIANGLEPFADTLLLCQNINVEEEAKKYINDKVKTVDDATNGAKDIIAERFSEDATFRQGLRDSLHKYGLIATSLKKDAIDEKKVYTLYYEKIKIFISYYIFSSFTVFFTYFFSHKFTSYINSMI